MSNLKIIATNSLNEPYNSNDIFNTPQLVNTNEYINFSYSSTSGLNLLGNEKYIWDFDFASVNKDQPIQESIGKFVMPALFKRDGMRSVNLKILERIPKIIVKVSSYNEVLTNSPFKTIYNPFLNHLYVLNTISNIIDVFDDNNVKIKTLNLTFRPIDICLGINNNYYILLANNSVDILDSLLETISNNIILTNTLSSEIIYNSSTDKIYCLEGSYIDVIDNSNSIIYTYNLSSNGKSLCNYNTFLYLLTSTQLVKIDLITNTVNYITTSTTPLKIVSNPSKNQLYIRCFSNIDIFNTNVITNIINVDNAGSCYDVEINNIQEEIYIATINGIQNVDLLTNTISKNRNYSNIFRIKYDEILQSLFVSHYDIAYKTTIIDISDFSEHATILNSGIISEYNILPNGKIVSPITLSNKLAYLSVFPNNTNTFVDGKLLYEDTNTFYVYSFPTKINGIEFGVENQIINYSTNDSVIAQSYEWYVNNIKQLSTLNNFNLTFINYVKATIKVVVVNGYSKKELTFTTSLSTGSSVLGDVYEGNIKDKLMFFNKEGDNLNFQKSYDDYGNFYWSGDMIFNENSSDTFKTIGLYTLEQVEPINYSSEDIFTRKTQIFNQTGLDIEKGYNHGQEVLIDSIEVVNTLDGFYSKWLNSPNIQNYFPIGSELLLKNFNNVLLDNNGLYLSDYEITDLKSFSTSGGVDLFTVVGNRRDGVMVITKTLNKNFINKYLFGEFRNSNNVITTVKQGSIQLYDYFKIYDKQGLDVEWNEPYYDTLFYDKKKLSFINTQNNDGVYTLNYFNNDKQNNINTKYLKSNNINIGDLYDINNGFQVKLSLKTNRVYLGNNTVDFLPKSQNAFLTNQDILVWDSLLNKDYTPSLITKNTKFSFQNSIISVNNFNKLYTAIKIDSAKNILTPQSNDVEGQIIKLLDYNNLSGLEIIILINNKTTYSLKEGIQWRKGNSLVDACVSLSTFMNDNIIGISVYPDNDTLNIHTKQNYICVITNNDKYYSLSTGVLDVNTPSIGIVGDKWVLLNSTDYDGYIHYRNLNNKYYILYYPNWYVLDANKKVVWVETVDKTNVNNTTIDYMLNGISNQYLEDTVVYLIQQGDSDINTTSNMLVERFIKNNTSTLNYYGLDVYVEQDNLNIIRNYTSDYIDVEYMIGSTSGYINSTSSYIVNHSVDIYNSVEPFNITERNRTYGIYKKPISENFNRKIIIKDIDATLGFNIVINGISYPSPYEIVPIRDLTPSEQNIINVERTLLNWGNNIIGGKYYFEILELNGILVWLEKSDESYVNNIQHYDTIVLESKYPNVNINFSVPNSFNTQKIIHSEISIISITSLLSITINRYVYSVNYTGNITSTIQLFVDTWKDTLIEQDVIIESKTNNILRFSTINENTSLVYSVWVGKNNILGNPFYIINNFKKGNTGIIISGNEIKNSNVDLESVGFSTAMITNFKNSKFLLNNQQYNIVYVDPNTLGLSYQGPFWNNTDNLGYNKLRSGFDFQTYNETIFEYNPLSGIYSSQGIVNINLPMNGYYVEYDTISENIWISMYGSLLNDKILIIDSFDNSTKGLINCGFQPYFMRLNTTNEMMYVSMTGNNSIYVYDIHNYNLVSIIPVGVSPKHLIIDYNTNFLYVCNEISDEITVIDCNTNLPITTIAVGNKPIKSVLDNKNKLLYVICETDNTVYVIDTNLNLLKNLISVGSKPSDIKFDILNYKVWVTNYISNTITQITYNIIGDNFSTNTLFSNVNPIAMEYLKTDKQIYVLSNNMVQIYDIYDNSVKYTIDLPFIGEIMKYNPITRAIIITSYNNNKIMIININDNYTVQSLNVGLSPTYLSYDNNGETYVINYQSSFVSDVFKINQNNGSSGTNSLLGLLTLTTREFLRYPRERFDGDNPIYFRYSWEDDNDTSMFLYDFSGLQLYNTMYNYFTGKTERINDYKTLNYVGSVPLIDLDGNAKLNKKYNYDLNEITNPMKQQTVFDELYFPLDVINSETNIDSTPYPIQTFIGYNSPNEGVNNRILKIERIENIFLSIKTKQRDPNNTNSVWLDVLEFNSSDNSIVIKNTTINFIESGFQKNQIIQITGKDYLNTKNQSTFKNAGFIGQISNVYINKIVFIPYNKNIVDEISLNSTNSIIPPFKTKISAYDMLLTVMPTTIAKINISGQTEIEDERFNVMLNNFGYNINYRDIYIFKEYDINENGIDWIFLNQKRKEMLTNYTEIYNYIGSYKSMINAINYFGYNDLELYEYYLNVDKNSPLYKKYYKVEIPDIFDTSVEGYHPIDFITKNLPDKRFQKTRLFNLTYRITDIDGNFVLAYSLNDVITKLLGLKKWLKNHIMPLGTRIKDITGRVDLNSTTLIKHDFKQNRIIKINEELTPVDFNIVAYQQPVENNSRTYNVHIEFFSENNIKPKYFQVNITTFSDSTMMRSVQIMKYYKTDMKSINIAADKNVDPFILVEVITENGYGSNYKVRRTYTLDKSKFL